MVFLCKYISKPALKLTHLKKFETRMDTFIHFMDTLYQYILWDNIIIYDYFYW